ncbi:MAG: DUF4336 domain-containing protein [Labilithrix sp.]|nr:DUF4336 domain-containing protein [Labilithrix sp.]
MAAAFAAIERIDEGLWTTTRPLRFFGVETGSRMTVMRVGDGLLVHSPVALDPELQREVDALGPVRAIVAPSKFHHLAVGQWVRAYPDALVYACPGLEKKRADVAWTGVLGDAAEEAWRGAVEQVFFGARTLENEVVFFHATSRTLVCADAVFNLAEHPSRVTRAVALLLGNRRPGATLLERVMMRDRESARAQIDRMLAWDFDRILLAHGAPIASGGRDVLRSAYAWL